MIIIKTAKEIELMRQGGRILAKIFKKILSQVKAGVSTGELEELAINLIRQAGGQPAFKGYLASDDKKVFPTALCTSINDEVVHAPALPSRRLKAGDIVGIDLGLAYPNQPQSYFTDVAATVAVGKVSREASRLIKTAKNALTLATRQVKSGNSLNQIGQVIEEYVKAQGFSVVRDLVGHGVGKAVHEEPAIPNYQVASNNKIILKPGMTLAIEPMINLGDWQVKTAEDGFTILTADGDLSAHFEQTVLVTETGHEILTKF